MRQFPLEELETSPGSVVQWRPRIRPGAGSGRPGEQASFNQAKHYSSIRGSRLEGDPLASWLAVTFEIEGEPDLAALEAAVLLLVRRHEVLRCEFERLAGDLSCAVHEAGDIELSRVERGFFASRTELLGFLADEFRRGIDTLAWPLCMAGAVVRPGAPATVYLAFDHIVSDGMSMLYVIDEVQRAYRAYARGEVPDLAEAGGYVDFARNQRDRYLEIGADDHRLGHWRKFAEDNGGVFPRFSPELGLEPGRTYPVTSEAGRLLDAGETAALEAACRAEGGRLFMGLLAAVGVTLREEGGREVYRGLMPVSERDRAERQSAIGWFVNTLPIAFPVHAGLGFGELVRGVRDAFEEMTRHAEVPFVRVWELLAPEHFDRHSWPYPVNFFSYIDTRRFPGAECHPVWKPALHVWASRSNGANSWFVRDAEGLHFNSLYASTPRARAVMTGIHETLRHTLREMSAAGLVAAR